MAQFNLGRDVLAISGDGLFAQPLGHTRHWQFVPRGAITGDVAQQGIDQTGRAFGLWNHIGQRHQRIHDAVGGLFKVAHLETAKAQQVQCGLGRALAQVATQQAVTTVHPAQALDRQPLRAGALGRGQVADQLGHTFRQQLPLIRDGTQKLMGHAARWVDFLDHDGNLSLTLPPYITESDP